MSDLISKKEVINYARKCADGYSYIELPIDAFVDGINALPSADADGEDLIIKGAKGIQDGLYNIKDGKLFKYKANGGTVRTYPIVPSADAVQGEWCNRNSDGTWSTVDFAYCSECKQPIIHKHASHLWRFCPNCGARMTPYKGGDDE